MCVCLFSVVKIGVDTVSGSAARNSCSQTTVSAKVVVGGAGGR